MCDPTLYVVFHGLAYPSEGSGEKSLIQPVGVFF